MRLVWLNAVFEHGLDDGSVGDYEAQLAPMRQDLLNGVKRHRSLGNGGADAAGIHKRDVLA